LKQAQADLKKDEAQMVSARLEFERTKKLFRVTLGQKMITIKRRPIFNPYKRW